MIRMLRAGLCLALVVPSALGRCQLFQPDGQGRLVTVRSQAWDAISVDPVNDLAESEADDFGPYSETLATFVKLNGALASAAATQESSIGPDRVVARGTTTVLAEVYEGGARGIAFAESRCVVTFAVNAPARYTLSGTASLTDTSLSSGLVQIGLLGGGLSDIVNVDTSETAPVDLTGSLAPGSYGLFLLACTRADTSFLGFRSGAAEYDVELILEPGPATFCNGFDDSLAACPCDTPSQADTGCDIQQDTGGVGLALVEQASAAENRVTWRGTDFPTESNPTAILIRSDMLDPARPVPFGDGLRCVGTPLVRLGAAFANNGSSTHVHGHASSAGSGEFYYQLWFRNTPATFCTPAAFNLSNGVVLTW